GGTRGGGGGGAARARGREAGLGGGGGAPAGGGDVPAAREGDSRRKPAAPQLRLERRDRLRRRAGERPGRVVRDQVHLEDLRIEHAGERACLLETVVYAGEHHVLDEDLAPAELEVAATLRKHVCKRIAVVDRHQLRPQ